MRPPLSFPFVGPLRVSSGPTLLTRNHGRRARRQIRQSPVGMVLRQCDNRSHDPLFRYENTQFGLKRTHRQRWYCPQSGVFSSSHSIPTSVSSEAVRWFRREVNPWKVFQTPRHYQERLRCFSSQDKNSGKSTSRRRRSPYAVLGLRGSSIAPDEIKAAFRKLAKIYHPDLNPHNRPLEECEFLMSELVEAYERLLRADTEDEFLENIRASNKVALACELYSVDELMRDRFHEVHPMQIKYENDGKQKEEEEDTLEHPKSNKEVQDTSSSSSSSLLQTATSFAVPIEAHPGDSVLDLKERLESEFGSDWGLSESMGWELLALRNKSRTKQANPRQESSSDNDHDDEDPTTVSIHNEVLSYHLFLEDYQIQHGDTIYAVVRKNDD